MDCKVKGERAKCWVRIKPTANFASHMIKVQEDHKTLNIFTNKEPDKKGSNNHRSSWSFPTDGILHNTSQENVYNCVAAEMVASAMAGFNGTLMCYGQTGSGKTYTMSGSCGNFHNRGIIPRALNQVFRDAQNSMDRCYTFMVSYFEIYNEMIYDLLVSPCDKQQQQQQHRSLHILETDQGIQIKGLRIIHVHSEEEAINLFFEGQINRAIASHVLNESSSRSHCVFTIYIGSYSRCDTSPIYTSSKLNLVDLAGSERLKKTQSTGKVREEATYINKTLLYLEHVISALAEQGRNHVPFRQSRLTLFLKDSIGGCCHTRLIANVQAEEKHMEEMLSTLRFTMSMMRINVKPVVNFKTDTCAYIRCLEEELNRLKKELYLHDNLANRTDVSYDPMTERQKDNIKRKVKEYMEGRSEEIEVINLVQINEIFHAFKRLSNEALDDLDTAYRNRYILLDKCNPEMMELAKKAGLVESPSSTELEAKTSPAQREQEADEGKDTTKKARDSSQVKFKTSKLSPMSPKRAGSETSFQNGEEEEEAEKADEKSEVPFMPEFEEPQSAPPRNEQFEIFKSTEGCELNRILLGNKNMLASKKKEYSLLAREVNVAKEQIDKSLQWINCMRCAREAEGLSYNESGEIIITEAEYLEIQRLKDLKKVYKNYHDQLRNLKSEILFCQNAVDQCRKRLLHEFDFWYFNLYAYLLIDDCQDQKQLHNSNFSSNAVAENHAIHTQHTAKMAA